jgi:hypothetical protein
MVRIDAFQLADFAAVVAFVEAIQEHERIRDLKLGTEIPATDRASQLQQRSWSLPRPWRGPLFHDLVGEGEQCRRNGQAERLGGL